MKPLIFSFILVASSISARGQSAIDWFSFDAGGGAHSSAAYVANFTLGQPDAGRASSTNYTVVGGFWALEDVGPATGVPELHIELVAGGVRLWWPSPSSGFQLQSSLAVPGGWSNVSRTPSDDGTNKSISLRSSQVPAFFRLRRP